MFVLNVVKKSSREVSTNVFKNEIEVRGVVQKLNGNLEVKVKRTRGSDPITELKITVYEEGGIVKTISKPKSNIELLNTEEITITSTDLSSAGLNPNVDVEKVSVIPIFGNKAGIESTNENVQVNKPEIVIQTQLEITNANIMFNDYSTNATVKLMSGDLTGLRFTFTGDTGQTYTFERTSNLPNEGETKTYNFDNSELNFFRKIQSISVKPFHQTTTGEEKISSGLIDIRSMLINGDAEKGTTGGFSPITDVSTDAYSGAYSFKRDGYTTILSNNLIPIDELRNYQLEGWFKSIGTTNSILYFGFAPYDGNKEFISRNTVNPILGTETELYESILEGQNIVKINSCKDASGNIKWISNSLYEHMAFNIKDNYEDLPNRDLSNIDIIGVTDFGSYCEVKFKTSVGKSYPAGTRVREHAWSENYIYCGAGGAIIPNTWTKYPIIASNCNVKGIRAAGSNCGYEVWWKGTKYAKVLMLANYGSGSDTNYKTVFDNIKPTYQ